MKGKVDRTKARIALADGTEVQVAGVTELNISLGVTDSESSDESNVLTLH